MSKPIYAKPDVFGLGFGNLFLCQTGSGASADGKSAYYCNTGGSESAMNACEPGSGDDNRCCGLGGSPWDICFSGSSPSGSGCATGSAI